MGNQLIDMTGKKIGRLTVLQRAENNTEGRARWLCECECGTQKIILGKDLRSGRIQSCGCLNREITSQRCLIDLTGQSFGKLTVLERIPGNRNGKVKWKCQCECGAIVDVAGDSLRRGVQKSCGCTASFGEEKIAELLQKNNIDFKKSWYFSDCYIFKGHPLRFDFGVLQNNELSYLIEYDGIQHYQVLGGWNTQEHFNDLKTRDTLKNTYCQEHSIPIIRIPYTQYENLKIDDLKLETSQFII